MPHRIIIIGLLRLISPTNSLSSFCCCCCCLKRQNQNDNLWNVAAVQCRMCHKTAAAVGVREWIITATPSSDGWLTIHSSLVAIPGSSSNRIYFTQSLFFSSCQIATIPVERSEWYGHTGQRSLCKLPTIKETTCRGANDCLGWAVL